MKITKLSGGNSGNREDVTPRQNGDIEQNISDRDFLVPSTENSARIDKRKLQEIRRRKKEELKKLHEVSSSRNWYLKHVANSVIEDSNLKWEDVDSSFINSVAYDKSRSLFYIKLKGGRKYAFKDVPAKEYKNLLNADSKGRAFNAIKQKYELY
jgi:hypothetical protein